MFWWERVDSGRNVNATTRWKNEMFDRQKDFVTMITFDVMRNLVIVIENISPL